MGILNWKTEYYSFVFWNDKFSWYVCNQTYAICHTEKNNLTFDNSDMVDHYSSAQIEDIYVIEVNFCWWLKVSQNILINIGDSNINEKEKREVVHFKQIRNQQKKARTEFGSQL